MGRRLGYAWTKKKEHLLGTNGVFGEIMNQTIPGSKYLYFCRYRAKGRSFLPLRASGSAEGAGWIQAQA